MFKKISEMAKYCREEKDRCVNCQFTKACVSFSNTFGINPDEVNEDELKKFIKIIEK